MPTTKKGNVSQPPEPNTNRDSQQSDQSRLSSDSEKEGKVKKKEGKSILSSLARFMSREKSQTPSLTNIEEIPNENDNTEMDTNSESESGGSQEPQVAEYIEVSSQTSDISVRRSSTLIAISKAVDALKEVRSRVAAIAKRNEDRDLERLHPEETQTSSYVLSSDNSDITIHLDPHLMLKNRHLSSNSFATTPHSLRYETRIENLSVSEPRSVSEQNLSRNRHEHPYHDQTHTHVSFSENQVPDRSIHPEEIYRTSSRERFSNDDSFFNNDGVLFHSTPKHGKGKDSRKKHPNYRFVKNANFQTEPHMEMKGTQTASPSLIMENDIDDGPNTAISLDNLSAEDVDTTVLAHRLLADREKCSKCDLFVLMFLHEGEKMLNDKDAVEMFARHMNSHLKKAKMEARKFVEKPRPIAIEVEHLHDILSVSQLGSNVNIERATEMTFQRGTNEKNPEMLDSRRNEFTRAPIKSESKIKDREYRMASTNDGFKAEKIRRKQRKNPRDRSILFNYLFKNGENCSEEVIIQRKNCKRDKNNYRNFENDNDDGRYENEQAGNSTYINCVNHRNTGRIKCSHVTGLCNNCNCWNQDCRCNDRYNYVCSTTEFGPRSNSDRSHRKKLTSKEKRFKWLVKGMLTVLKGYHGVNRRESDSTKTKDITTEEQPKEDKKEDAKNADAKLDVEKTETTPEAKPEPTTTEPQPSSSPPTEGTNPASEAQGTDKKREGSVLSDIAFFMVKDEENKEKEVPPPDPDVENKPSSGQESIASSSPDEKLVAELLSNWVRNGKICGDRTKSGSSGDDNGKSPNSFDLKDPKVQKFVQDILKAFCSEVLNHEETTSSRGSEIDYADEIVSSCPSSNSPEIQNKFCEIIKGATKTTENTRTRRKNSDTMPSQCRETANESTPVSYFYPFCNDNNNNAASFNSSQFCYCRSSFGGSCCSGRAQRNTNTNYCAFPTQVVSSCIFKRCELCDHRRDNSRRNNTASSNRAKMRQECTENCRIKMDSQQRPRKQSQTKATRNPIPRHATRENPLCVCNLTAGTTNNQPGNVCDAFTYVVPQARMFWQCSDEQNE